MHDAILSLFFVFSTKKMCSIEYLLVKIKESQRLRDIVLCIVQYPCVCVCDVYASVNFKWLAAMRQRVRL